MTGREVAIWNAQLVAQAGKLHRWAREAGAAEALRLWRQMIPAARVTYVHGLRHDLWWEFLLSDSFRWQSHVCGLAPRVSGPRIRFLADALDLGPLMGQRVSDLTRPQRASANLAVALLPRPRGLVWEEPFLELPPRARERAVELVRSLCASEGLTVLLVSSTPPGLAGLGAPALTLAGHGAAPARDAAPAPALASRFAVVPAPALKQVPPATVAASSAPRLQVVGRKWNRGEGGRQDEQQRIAFR